MSNLLIFLIKSSRVFSFVDSALLKKSSMTFFFSICQAAFMIMGSMLASSDDANAQPFFPEPNPPVELRTTAYQAPLSKDYFLNEALTEWIYHKTADGLHPSGIEQQMVWLMNRARANPTSEGIWLATSHDPDIAIGRDYFQVDTTVLQGEFAAYSAKPPAAFDARLYNAAKEHSEYLISIDDQNHDGQFDKIDAAGFSYISARGNVFSYADDGLNAHAAFNIDWGWGTVDGMQAGRGHRQAIMSLDGDYTNVGIASVSEVNPTTSVGPEVVTENFCRANPYLPNHYNRFIVGTVWEDLNFNNIYDPGEGKSGVTVMPDSGEYYAITSDNGGYAFPATVSGDYQVSFSGNAVPVWVASVSINDVSVLLDYIVGESPSNDYDKDDVTDDVDNCPLIYNPGQEDSDGDGIGDVCDLILEDGIGLLDPGHSAFYLKNELSGGAADTSFRFGPKYSGWAPIAGDWNGNGQTTIALFDPDQSRFYTKDTNSGGSADLVFNFGPNYNNWQPIAGDWDGDGQCSIGLYDPLSSTFYLKNELAGGRADFTFRFGPSGAGWHPIVGDWDGDGMDTIGLYSPENGRFYLKNTLSGGVADLLLQYGPKALGWLPVCGDWNGNGTDGIGLFDPTTSSFYLKNSFSGGNADIQFSFGPDGMGWLPLAGSW